MGSSRENRMKRQAAARAERHAVKAEMKRRFDRLIFIIILSAVLILAIAVTAIVAVKNKKDEDKDNATSTSATPNTFTSGSLTYAKLEGGDLSVFIYNGDDTKVEIPAYIDGKSVVQIDSYAFLNENKITEVTVGENVKEIGDGVFEGCTGLSKITLYNTLQTIREDAFKDCTSIKNVIFYGTGEEFSRIYGGEQLSGIDGIVFEYRSYSPKE